MSCHRTRAATGPGWPFCPRAGSTGASHTAGIVCAVAFAAVQPDPALWCGSSLAWLRASFTRQPPQLGSSSQVFHPPRVFFTLRTLPDVLELSVTPQATTARRLGIASHTSYRTWLHGGCLIIFAIDATGPKLHILAQHLPCRSGPADRP